MSEFEDLTWTSLHNHFKSLIIRVGGPTKSNSGVMTVERNFDGQIDVMLGTYDIPAAPSIFHVGIFADEVMAMEQVKITLDHFEKNIAKDESDICEDCHSQIDYDDGGTCDCSGELNGVRR